MKATDNRGALTVEAAIVLPVILCAFFSVVFLIRTVYTYELIQHALTETASEIASAGYIYHVSGVRDLHDTVRDSINDRSELFREQADSILDAYNILKGTEGRDGDGSGDGDINSIIDDFDNVIDHAESILSDPLNELKIIVSFIADGALDDVKTQLLTPLVKLYMKKYLITDKMTDVDERLTSLDIIDGFDGLDFSDSAFLSDTEETMDIVVKYRVRLPLPVKFTKDLEFVQRVKVKAWMGGDEKKGVLGGYTGSKADDIWSLSNFQRGLKIRRIFGANLPENFPVIAKFENGKAVMIKSMDLTAESYQTPKNAEKTLKRYVNELTGYKGQDKPWGRDDITIRSSNIEQKELLLIIPENKLSENIEGMLEDIVRYADSRGIKLTIKRYGVKKTDEDHNETGGTDKEEVDEAGKEVSDEGE
jgi:hypothetical protein